MGAFVSWSHVVQVALWQATAWTQLSQVQNKQISILCIDTAISVPERQFVDTGNSFRAENPMQTCIHQSK
jgi:hypothetical protein